jgi:hypothetical protein
MKTRIKKIIMIAAALIFVSAGVSFAHDWNDRNHKPPGKTYGYYQVKRLPPGWANKNFRPNPPITKRRVAPAFLKDELVVGIIYHVLAIKY